jgi:hypothetical protein
MTAKSSKPDKKRKFASDSEGTRSHLPRRSCGHVFAAFLEQMAEHNAKQMAKHNPEETTEPMSPVLNAARRTTIVTRALHFTRRASLKEIGSAAV